MARLEDLALGGSDVNPLKSDPELQILLKKLDKIKKYKKFQGWKAKFLDRLEQFLYEEGMTPANKACNDFESLLKKFVKRANKVEEFVEKGELSDVKKTVKAALALNEMCNDLTTTVSAIENLVPSSGKEEKKRGFTKFHMGAVLIRMGFHQYITMTAIQDALNGIQESIDSVMDKQQNELFVGYKKQLQRFCDIMADLNLYEVMMKCLLFQEEPEDESEGPEEIAIIIKTFDGKTLRLEVEITETIGSVKDAIAPGCGLDPDKQVLTFRKKELCDNGQTLEKAGIVDGAVLHVEPVKVPVTVNTFDGKKIQIMVNPLSTIEAIKHQLQEESGLEPENMKLSQNGVELNDDTQTAEFYGIKAGSQVDLEPKSMKVTVKMPNGKSHDIVVTPRDSGAAIKAKIEAETGMKSPRQLLKHDGTTLQDDKTAMEMGITNGSTINVEVFTVPVTVNTMDGKQIKINVDPTEKLGNIKRQLENESGIPADNQTLFLQGKELLDDDKTAAVHGIGEGSELDLEPKSIKVTVFLPNGKSHTVELNPSDNTDVIKAKIEKVSGMKASRQLLMQNGKELPAGKTVRNMGIQDGSEIKVEVLKVPVTVNTMDGKQIKIMVDPTEKLGSIKTQLEKDAGISADNIKLSMKGKELVDDEKTAKDYGIKEGSELDLEPKTMNVTIEMPDGNTHAIEVKPSDTSDDLKAKIHVATGMEVPRQVLKMNGRELPSDKNATGMGIADGSKIKVEIFKVPITVNSMDGKKIKVQIDPTEKLKDIKKLLEDESGVPAKNQKLFLNGEELVDDNKSAGDHGVKANSVLDMEPKTIKVSVDMPDGKTADVEINPGDTSDQIKAKIETKTGMRAPRQVLSVNGKELPGGGKTVKDMGLKDGTTIKVGIFTLPITVKTHDGKTLNLNVEPSDTIETIKKMIKKETGIDPKRQCLKLGEEELTKSRDTVEQSGIRKGSELTLEQHVDAIIFVDIKCGTLFALDRDVVIERKALTPNQGNQLDFLEAVADASAREKVLQLMKESPNLGVAPQVVVTKLEVDNYELEEAEKVKSMWGVNLKKREKNKKGEEFIFVDAKTGACGELSRKKFVDMGIITPVTTDKGEDIKEAEKDTMVYDKYVRDIRNVFGIKSAT